MKYHKYLLVNYFTSNTLSKNGMTKSLIIKIKSPIKKYLPIAKNCKIRANRLSQSVKFTFPYIHL